MFKSITTRRGASIVITCATLASALLAANSARAGTCVGGTETLDTLEVRYSAPRHVYRVGETIRVQFEVIRHTDGHELGPAEGVTVSIVLRNRNNHRIVVGGAVTDSQGQATAKVRLTGHLLPGKLHASGFAEKEWLHCPRTTEWGERHLQDFVTLVR